MVATKVNIPLKSLVLNKGQVEGLPKNARHITERQFELLMKSLHEDPEMLELRPIITIRQGDKYLIIAGEQRFRAAKKLMLREIPAFVLPEGTEVKKLRAIAIKDNHNNGVWDWDEIANAWDLSEVLNFGVELPFIDKVPPEGKEKEPKPSKMITCPHCGETFAADDKVDKGRTKKRS